MDLLEVLGISPPAEDSAVCFELYDDSFVHGVSDTALQALGVRCMQLAMPHLEAYVWQHEPFSLRNSVTQPPAWHLKAKGKGKQQHDQALPCLWGAVRYGDNVEDEWFIVWLLLELTKQLPGISVRVWDDDGDFLLIEAAYTLPRWLKPETATNRVWLRAGGVHVIPQPSAKSPGLPPYPTIRDAIDILQSGRLATHQPRIGAAIQARLAGYPQKAWQQMQRVTTWLPRCLALLLREDPQMVSPAVNAFMTRQRREVQAAAKQSNFPTTNMATTLVTVNHCMYAQLHQVDFNPPSNWPQPAADWLGGNSARQAKAISMGAKIATGMEIMCLRLGLTGTTAAAMADQQQQQQQQQASEKNDQPGAIAAQQPVVPTAAQLSANPVWQAYLASLHKAGYFAGELEGSAKYRQLLAAAQEAFIHSEAYAKSCEAVAAPAQRLQHLLTATNQVLHQGDMAIDQDSSSYSSTERAATTAGQSVKSSSNIPVVDTQDAVTQSADAPVQGTSPGAGKLYNPAAAILDADSLLEDSDGWLFEAPALLQQQLEAREAEMAAYEAQRKSQQQQQQANGDSAAAINGANQQQEQVVDAEHLIDGFKGFVQHLASHEGAEVPVGLAAAATISSKGAVVKPTNKAKHGAAASHSQQQSAAGLDFDADVLLSELMALLGPEHSTAAGSSSSKSSQQQQQQQLSNSSQPRQQMSEQEAAAMLARLPSLQQQLLQRLGAEGGEQQRVGISHSGSYSDSDDEYATSSSEGSSFYGSDEGSDSDNEGLEGTAEELSRQREHQHWHDAEWLSVPPPVSAAARQQQHSSQQQHQQLQQPAAQLPPGQPQQQQYEVKQQQQWQLPPSFISARRQQQQDVAWEVVTATDSDDDDALSIGGYDSDNSSNSGTDSFIKNGGNSHVVPRQTQQQQQQHTRHYLGRKTMVSSRHAAAVSVGSEGHDEDKMEGNHFFEAYNSAMEAELAGTTLVQSFERANVQKQEQASTSTPGGGDSASSSNGVPGDSRQKVAPALSVGLAPLDVDMNMIRSLVASYTAQGGMPGPASNLAGLLGLQLPTELQEEM